MKAPHGLEEIKRFYGDVKIGRVNGHYDIVSPPHWEGANCLVLRDLPGLYLPNGGPKPLYVHKKIEAPLRAALAAWQSTCPEYKIRTIGCFNPRFKRTNGSALSVHTWAAAIDINASTNPQGEKLVTDMPDAFVACFVNAGWTWGGKFPRPDAQHFQYCSGY